MVFRIQRIQELDVKRFTPVDPRETYVLPYLEAQFLITLFA